MNGYTETLSNLSRPKLLIRAARAGLNGYRREAVLKSLPEVPANSTGAALINVLLDIEEKFDTERRAASIDYRVQKHIAVLTALIAETSHGEPVLEYKMVA